MSVLIAAKGPGSKAVADAGTCVDDEHVTNPRSIRYMRHDGWALAYQVVGEGPDLVYLPPLGSNLDWNWRHPDQARFLGRLASFSRLILMDRRGWGCSDRFSPGESPDLDTLVEDLIVILDAVNALRPAVFAANESGYVALRAAAMYPERFASLVLFDASPVWIRKDDLPWEYSEEAAAASVRSIERASSWDEWGRAWVRDELPSIASDDRTLAWVTASWNCSIALGALAS